MFEEWLAMHQKHEQIKMKLENFFLKQGVNLNTYTVCYILKDQPNLELRVTELSQKLGLSTSATSRLATKMEAETGFVRREICEEDNRALYIVLTAEGKQFLEEGELKVHELLAHQDL
ncbi:MarR family winged helix-turn-helix transcriptional regulator [Streptococcus himalayensis]|uniref:HTH marR-type domain-containing protein n=1 Tax=Streptococcus himalayensis TaxID=1888195 RepID=A0A917EGP3_9STRE|nr:MarR family transcriptional regulator [Streptococcus himalayensis]GGE37519.1 hypothetical protein GCM10011510_18560 [Streptococcus himalayensis]